MSEDPHTPIVSVVVPVYNVESYLGECLDSVLGQTLRDVEVICIDDGSSDRSASVLSKYADEDSRVRVLTQRNIGLSATRNRGLEEARGTYVYFLDSDDRIELRALEQLTRFAEENALDVVLFDGDAFYENDRLREAHPLYQSYYVSKNAYPDMLDGPTMFARLTENKDFRSSACLQLTRTRHLREHRITFLEGIVHEDILFTVMNLLAARRVAHLGEILFHRRVRDDSIMTSPTSTRNFIGYFSCMSRMIGLLDDRLPDHANVALEHQIRAAHHSAKKALGRLSAEELDAIKWDEGTPEHVLFDLLRPSPPAASSGSRDRRLSQRIKRWIRRVTHTA